MKIQRGSGEVPIKSIIQISKKYKCKLINIEPYDEAQRDYYLVNGFKKTKEPSLPSKTIRIDLSKTYKQLLSQMHQKSRYNIGLSKQKKVRVIKSKNIDEFAENWQASAKKRGMYFSQKHEIKSIYQSFGNQATILNAKFKDETIASILLLSTDKLLYYMYAYSSQKGNRMFAPSFLVWEALRLGKKIKLKYFDFEGVYDERFPLKSWKGFTRFKKSFGGEAIEFPEPVKKYFIPLFGQ